ncbi:MAG TPA: sulfite exporter TauE/SafE family protein, partial [Chloroflexia bacterium]|nr:sulfite exporter TauE/SafE family protein [Chloroflexia bacterium]
MDFWLTMLAFVAFGLCVGAYGTLIGAGGGFIIVPVLLLVLKWPHEEAVATSLCVVTANAASGTISYWRQGRVDFRTGIQFAVATLPGAVIGSLAVSLLSGRVFDLIFGLLLVLLSTYLMLRPERRAYKQGDLDKPPGAKGWLWTVRSIVDAQGENYTFGFSRGWGLVLSFGVGFMSSILGIGGGIIHVPALISLFGFPAHIATATSHFILAISAATGSTTQLIQGNVHIAPAIAMAIGAIGGAQIGGRLSRRITGKWIVRGLAVA